MNQKLLWSISLLLLLFSCAKSTDTPTAETTPETTPVNTTTVYLTASEKLKSLSINSINLLSGKLFSESSTPLPIKYEVTGTKIIYNTLFKDHALKASGIIIAPNTNESLPIISFQHGTITALENIPSKMTLGSNEVTLASIIAAMGFIIIMPDYIGYGESENVIHPYELKSGLGKPNLDFISAAYEHLDKEAIAYSEKLFVGGYSEGGYASMALLNALEEEQHFNVTHAYLGGGAYNKSASLKAALRKTEHLPYMRNYLWVLQAYNAYTEGLNHPWSFYVQAPYAPELEAIEDWRTAKFSENFPLLAKELFTSEFLSLALDENSNSITNAFVANDVFDWYTKTPISLFHGTEDDFVYPINAVTTETKMKARGVDITYYPIAGKNHQTAVLPFIAAVLESIVQLM